jgi:hypothetical protein
MSVTSNYANGKFTVQVQTDRGTEEITLNCTRFGRMTCYVGDTLVLELRRVLNEPVLLEKLLEGLRGRYSRLNVLKMLVPNLQVKKYTKLPEKAVPNKKTAKVGKYGDTFVVTNFFDKSGAKRKVSFSNRIYGEKAEEIAKEVARRINESPDFYESLNEKSLSTKERLVFLMDLISNKKPRKARVQAVEREEMEQKEEKEEKEELSCLGFVFHDHENVESSALGLMHNADATLKEEQYHEVSGVYVHPADDLLMKLERLYPVKYFF